MTPVEELRSKETLQVHTLQGMLDCPEVDWRGVNFDPVNLPSYTDCRGPFLNWLKRCLSEAFAVEIQSLRLKWHVKKRSCLIELSPIIGNDGLLREGGRIGAATLPFDNLHPIILPAKHPLTDKIAFHDSTNAFSTSG